MHLKCPFERDSGARLGGYGCRGTLPGRTINFGRIREDSVEILENSGPKKTEILGFGAGAGAGFSGICFKEMAVFSPHI